MITSLMDTSSWKLLAEHRLKVQDRSLRTLFEEDSKRFERFSLDIAPLFFDYSKNFLTEHTLKLLCHLAEERGLPDAIDKLLAGTIINRSERRLVGHTALRNPTQSLEKNEIQEVLERMRDFVARVRQGVYPRQEGPAITDIIHIGIGGSDLGPALFYEACRAYPSPIRCHFISTYNHEGMRSLLSSLHSERTLVVVVSKTFTTKETLFNAAYIRKWLFESLGDSEQVALQMLAVTANSAGALQWGIKSPQIFPIWDWVGGRYSVWSAVSLSVALAIGMEAFEQLLKGAYFMDQHFQSAALNRNGPVILALLGVWYRHFFHANNKAIIPYSPRLQFLPTFLQQLFMESQGKLVSNNGTPLNYPVGSIIWGGVGTNSQHSFHQFLFQGSEFIPVDFILPMKNQGEMNESNLQMIAQCLAQSKVLLEGTQTETSNVSHQTIPGNQPSNVFLIDEIKPYSLGALFALYEHCVFTQNVIWGINSFDQWGVEYGKTVSEEIFTFLQNKKTHPSYDASTSGLLKKIFEKDTPQLADLDLNVAQEIK
jgi:glucose-6-phosphate isomerase